MCCTTSSWRSSRTRGRISCLRSYLWFCQPGTNWRRGRTCNAVDCYTTYTNTNVSQHLYLFTGPGTTQMTCGTLSPLDARFMHLCFTTAATWKYYMSTSSYTVSLALRRRTLAAVPNSCVTALRMCELAEVQPYGELNARRSRADASL